MANKNIESLIRDWLSQNLSFIENDLSLIGVEFHLPDCIGSRGYIDILATDRLKNFVIIEIKRANSSARQTMTEILKYHALIKQKYKAKDSEIRIIIISTHWSEIIRAFSELADRTSYAIKGFEITIDPETSVPQSIEERLPLSPKLLERQFSRIYSLDLFYTKDKRTKFKTDIINLLETTCISNYIFIDLDSIVHNRGVMYPYVSVLIFQQLSDEEILSALEKLNGESYHTDLDLSKGELTDYLVEELTCSLYRMADHDSTEAGYPEKIDAELSSGNWSISDISRYGIFAEDPRFDDELLLNEVRGLAGNNIDRYSGIAESTQPERVKELINNSQYCLDNATSWLVLTQIRLNQVLDHKEKVRIALYVYNPQATIEHIAFSFIKNNFNYIPFYQLTISHIDKPLIEIYTGSLSWNGKQSRYSLLKQSEDLFSTYLEIHWGTDSEIKLTAANLFFSVTKILIEEENIVEESLVRANELENDIIIDDRNSKSLIDWQKESPNFLLELLSIYKTTTNV